MRDRESGWRGLVTVCVERVRARARVLLSVSVSQGARGKGWRRSHPSVPPLPLSIHEQALLASYLSLPSLSVPSPLFRHTPPPMSALACGMALPGRAAVRARSVAG